MERKLGLIAALALATGTPAAAVAAESGFYFGAFGGQASYDLNQEEFDELFIDAFNSIGAPIVDGESDLDDNDTALGILAGYRFNPYLAVEAAYIDLGSGEYNAEGIVDLPGPSGLAAFAGGVEVEATGPAVSVLGIWPVAEAFDLYARLGLFFSDTEVKISIEDESQSLSGSDEDVFYGIGAAWNLGDHWSLRLDYQLFQDVGSEEDTGEDDVDMWSIGVLFRI